MNLNLFYTKEEIENFKIQYFTKENETKIIWIYPPRNKYNLLTILRKIGDSLNRYVTSVRYLDTLEYSYDRTEIYSVYDFYGEDDDNKIVYSSYHSNCDICQGHKKDAKENKIVGIKIYAKGKVSPRYKDRKDKWLDFV